MKSILIAAALATAAFPAHAISRYNSMTMTCSEVQALVRNQGAVILRYPGTSNPTLTLYDRYIVDRRFCMPTEFAANAWVPTRDQKSCFVRKCKEIDYDDLLGNW